MISVLLDELKLDIDKWNNDSKIKFIYEDEDTKEMLNKWKIEGCPFNTVCDIINDVMRKSDLQNMISFVVKSGSGEIEYEHAWLG